MFGEKIEHSLFEPICAAELDAEPYVAWQSRHELTQRATILRRQLKLRRHLHKHAGESLFQHTCTLAKLFQQLDAAASERSLMRHLLRQLQRESETIRRALHPTLEG